MVKAHVVAAFALASTGCDLVTNSFETNPFSGDPFPIIAETDSGALVVGMQEAGSTGFRNAVLDVLAPITLIDRGPDRQPQFNERTYTVFGARAPGLPLDQPRARFTGRVATLHPCALEHPVCEVGTPTEPRNFDAVIGMDAFASDALRLRVATRELFVFPDIAGDDVRRSQACDAVFPTPFRGGGTLILGGAEVSFPNRRIAIDACLAPHPDPRVQIPQRDRGLDALLVLSTALSTSLLNETTYARYREVFPTEPELTALPEHTVFLPSGPVSGHLTSLPSIAFVGNLSSAPRAPCRQVYASHLLESGTCKPGVDCPCEDGEKFCAAPAIVELAPPERLPVLIVADSNPTLQALRTELRPDRPEVDGILGTSALAAIELDIDYANDRLLARCLDTQTCGTRVTLADDRAREYLITCIGDDRGPFP